MPTYEQNKTHIYNWREKNPDYAKEYYELNKRKNFDKSNGRRRFLTAAKKFRFILMDIFKKIDLLLIII